jgi:hypothetical protein
VDCWIGIGQEADRSVVRLAGRLTAAQVPELLETCATSGGTELHVADLVSADAAGIEALQQLRDRGVRLVGMAVYLQLKLDAHPPAALPFTPPRSVRAKKQH